MKFKAYVRFFTIAILVIALDQWTKSLVREMPLYSIWLPEGMEWLQPYARVIHSYNTGAAFGSFENLGVLFALLAVVVAGLLVYYLPSVAGDNVWMQIAMGLQLGGALGNVIDRLLFDMRVTDFISVGNFAIFNIADSGITVGTTILVIGLIIMERKSKSADKLTELEGSEDQIDGQ